MNSLEIAEKYMNCLFNSGDMVELRGLLDDDLCFKGTFFEYDSADEYMEGFEDDNFTGFSYEILSSFEKNNEACIVYNIVKPSGKLICAQLFKCEDGKINEMTLIFDGAQAEDAEADENDWDI